MSRGSVCYGAYRVQQDLCSLAVRFHLVGQGLALAAVIKNACSNTNYKHY